MDFVEMLKSWDYPPLSLVLVDVASQGSPFPRIPSQSRSLVLKAHQDSSYDHSKESTTMQTKKKKNVIRNLHITSLQGHPTAIFGKYLFGRRFEI